MEATHPGQPAVVVAALEIPVMFGIDLDFAIKALLVAIGFVVLVLILTDGGSSD
jgi:hypothetical protein